MEPSYFQTLCLNQGKHLLGTTFLAGATLINADVFSDDAVHLVKKCVEQSGCGLVAGPPCQSFSTLGLRRGEHDPRGNLTWQFFNLIADLRPPFFLFENVPPLGQRPGAALREKIYELLTDAGYNFEGRVLNMADYGCYTKRKRFIVLGRRGAPVKFPDQTHSAEPTPFRKLWLLSADALAGLPSPYTKNDMSHHDAVYHTEGVRMRFLSLRPGQYDRKRHRSKLDPTRPSPTLVAGAAGGYCHHIHWESRELTSRESARLHGFPDNFSFAGTKLDVAKQIANSVPVDFGRAFGGAMYHALRLNVECA